MVTFSPDGCYLFTGGWEGELICWDTRTMQRCLTIGHQSWIAQFRADGRECAIIADSGIELHTFARPNHREFSEDLGPRLRRAAFSRDGKWLTASAEQCLGVWDLTCNGPGVLAKQADEARPMFTSNGKELFASSSVNTCSRWRISPGTNAAEPPQLQPVEVRKPEGFTSVAV